MYLRSDTKQILEKALGKTVRQLAYMTVDEEREFVEKKIGRKPIFSDKVDHRKVARGSHQLAQKRIMTMESVNDKIMGWKTK